ncbi:MAG: carbohydrate ABC transporter permease [Nitratireductor sp.]|nr:carbohydrate ABC transporter permease [Nitratireductor sp.]
MNLITRVLLLLAAAIYTIIAGGPLVWIADMSLRSTQEILANPYGLPSAPQWHNYAAAWSDASYGVYFKNSTIVVACSVTLVTLIGAMAAHGLARYQFRWKNAVFMLLFSSILFPPQLTIIALFQMLVEYGLINSLVGLICVYVAIHLPLTVYLLEGFFSQIPQDLYDAAKMDGYSNYEIFWRITLPIGIPAVATTVILNLIDMWNEFLYAVVIITDDEKRTLPLGIMKFLGDYQTDYALLATGLMISVIPVIVLYALFSERVVRGMTAGAIK